MPKGGEVAIDTKVERLLMVIHSAIRENGTGLDNITLLNWGNPAPKRPPEGSKTSLTQVITNGSLKPKTLTDGLSLRKKGIRKYLGHKGLGKGWYKIICILL